LATLPKFASFHFYYDIVLPTYLFRKLKAPEQNNPQAVLKKKKGKRHLFNAVAMFCNHIAAISLLISYLAPHVSPGNFWFIAFFGLGYPILVFINFLFVIYWGIQRKKRTFYSLLIILVGWIQLQEYVQFNFGNAPDKSRKVIKLMSYNVKSFDLYNWNNDKDTRTKMFDLISAESPDIMCLQEFYTRDSSVQFNNLDTLIQIQKATNVHVEYTTVKSKSRWGAATFTVYPIIAKGEIPFDNTTNICIYTDIKINNDTVRVYNVHLQSIHFGYPDYKFVDDIMSNKETEELENSKNILRRLKRAFIKRSVQTDIVAEHIENSPYPVIVCGDFNDPPASYAYNTISKNLKDAFIESGNGFGRTYIGKFPSFRIDYVMHSKEYKAYNFRTIREKLSDHFPLCCYLEKQ
jgi:endonuclease/exonuclease/phosphatase family metal-dependent hydrolase